MSYLRPGTANGQLFGFTGTPRFWQGSNLLPLPDQGVEWIGSTGLGGGYLGAGQNNFDVRMVLLRRGTAVQVYAELASSGWTAANPATVLWTGTIPVGLRPASIQTRNLSIMNGAAVMPMDFYSNGDLRLNRPATVIGSPVAGRSLFTWSTV